MVLHCIKSGPQSIIRVFNLGFGFNLPQCTCLEVSSDPQDLDYLHGSGVFDVDWR